MDRRTAQKRLLSGLTALLLIDTASVTRSIAAPIRPILDDWTNELNSYCRDLKLNNLSQHAWQSAIEQLFGRIPLEDIVKYIEFTSLKKGLELPDLGVNARTIPFPSIDGLSNTVYFQKIFGLREGRAIIPHGHSNMVSSHLVLEGNFYLRHFDKVDQQEDQLIIAPSQERSIGAGDHSSISDSTDNIHWFIAESGPAYTFDVILINLNEKAYDIHNLDMDTAEQTSNGLLRVKELDVDSALRKYGKIHH